MARKKVVKANGRTPAKQGGKNSLGDEKIRLPPGFLEMIVRWQQQQPSGHRAWKRLMRPSDDRVRAVKWEAILYHDHLVKLEWARTVVSGYGTLCIDDYSLDETQHRRRHVQRLLSELSMPSNLDTYSVGWPDFTLVDRETGKIRVFVEVKTRASHGLTGDYDTIPLEPNVVDPFIRQDEEEPGYTAGCLLIIIIERFKNERNPKILWKFIDESLAVDLRVNRGWGCKMYNPKLSSFHDNDEEPFLDALRQMGM